MKFNLRYPSPSAVRNTRAPAPCRPLQCSQQQAPAARAAPVQLVDQVLADLRPQGGTAFLPAPERQREVNALLEQIASQQAEPDVSQLPGNYALVYVSSPNSRAISKSNVERVLRNTALRRLAQGLPLGVMGGVMESKVFEAFARKSFDDADLDRDGRLTCAEFWVSMLLMYNRVNAWLPFKAVPPSRTEIQDIFNYYDRDDSDNLSYEEFRVVVCALLADEDSLADSFAYRWVKTFVARLWIQPFEAIMAFLPKSLVDTSLITTEQTLGLSRLLFERKELLQQVTGSSIHIACDLKILRGLPGTIGVSGTTTATPQGGTLLATASFDAPQVSLPLGVHLQFGKARTTAYQIAYVDDRVKVVIGKEGTYYLFERRPVNDPCFASMEEAGSRKMQPAAKLMLATIAAVLAASGAALWGYDRVVLVTAVAVLGSLAVAVGEQVALNALQFGNEVAALPVESVDDVE